MKATTGLAAQPHPETLASSIATHLRPALAAFEQDRHARAVFLRDDDIDDDEASLRRLLELTLARGVPLHLAVVPRLLTPAGTRLLKDMKRTHGDLLEVGQHGYTHRNHEPLWPPGEFGPSRDFDAQLRDVTRGKVLLERALGGDLAPVFTPPWNRSTGDTHRALDRLGFQILSQERRDAPPIGEYDFREISVTLDPYRWPGGRPHLKSPGDIFADLARQLVAGGPVGVLLHHKVMGEDAFVLLERLLAELTRCRAICFQTLQGVAL